MARQLKKSDTVTIVTLKRYQFGDEGSYVAAVSGELTDEEKSAIAGQLHLQYSESGGDTVSFCTVKVQTIKNMLGEGSPVHDDYKDGFHEAPDPV